MKVELAERKVSQLEKCSITEQTEIATLPAQTRGLGRLRRRNCGQLSEICLVANLIQSSSAFIRALNFFFFCQSCYFCLQAFGSR